MVRRAVFDGARLVQLTRRYRFVTTHRSTRQDLRSPSLTTRRGKTRGRRPPTERPVSNKIGGVVNRLRMPTGVTPAPEWKPGAPNCSLPYQGRPGGRCSCERPGSLRRQVRIVALQQSTDRQRKSPSCLARSRDGRRGRDATELRAPRRAPLYRAESPTAHQRKPGYATIVSNIRRVMLGVELKSSPPRIP